MAKKGRVVAVRLDVAGEALQVLFVVRTQDGEVEALLPDRETAALLPRTVLAGDSKTVNHGLIDTLAPIAGRMSRGRTVRLWSFRDRWYCAFESWRGVRFVRGDPRMPA